MNNNRQPFSRSFLRQAQDEREASPVRIPIRIVALILLLTTIPLQASATRYASYHDQLPSSISESPHDYLLTRLTAVLDICSTSLNFATDPDDRKRLNSVMKLKTLQRQLIDRNKKRTLAEALGAPEFRSFDDRALTEYEEVIDALSAAHPASSAVGHAKEDIYGPEDELLSKRQYTVTSRTAYDALEIAIEDFILANKSCLLLEATSVLQTVERVFLKSLVQTIYTVVYAQTTKGRSQVDKEIKRPSPDVQDIGLTSFKVLAKWMVDEAIPNHHVSIMQRICELVIPYCVAYAVAHGLHAVDVIDDIKKIPSPTPAAVGIDILTSASLARFYCDDPQLRSFANGWAWGFPLLQALNPKKLVDGEYDIAPFRKLGQSALARLGLSEVLPGIGSYGTRYLPDQIKSSPRKKAVIGLATLFVPALFTVIINQATAAYRKP